MHYHRLDAEADREFLARGETDPFTGVAFRPSNVVVMTGDGTVLLRESWEALGERYEGSAETLAWASGDGATTAPPTPEAPRTARAPLPAPPRQHAPPPKPMPDHVRERRAKHPWLLPLLGVLAVALVLVVALLIASRMGGPEPVEPVVVEQETPDAPAVFAIEEGVTEGSLAEGDARGSGDRYEDRYAFAADSSGRVLTFVLASDDFRPDLVVVGPDGQRYEAEASGEDGERVVVSNLRGPGTFRLLVTSREPAGEGDYSIRVRQETPIRQLAADGRPVTATLGERSERVDGFFRDTYEFPVEAEREYTLTLASAVFEPVPTLTGSRGARIQTQKEGNALTFTPTEDGRYRLVVSSREKGKRGAYTLQLRAGAKAAEEAPVAARTLVPNASPARDSLAAGEQKTYTFAGRVGDRVRVDARALGFSPSLVLVGPDGRRMPGQTSDERASVSETLASEGTYRVVVSGGEGSGLFQLSMEKSEAPRAADIPRLPGVDTPPAPAPAPRQGEDYRPQPLGGDSPE